MWDFKGILLCYQMPHRKEYALVLQPGGRQSVLLFYAVTGYSVIVSSYFHLWEGELQWRKEERMD